VTAGTEGTVGTGGTAEEVVGTEEVTGTIGVTTGAEGRAGTEDVRVGAMLSADKLGAGVRSVAMGVGLVSAGGLTESDHVRNHVTRCRVSDRWDRSTRINEIAAHNVRNITNTSNRHVNFR